jgi:DNA-binding transcriptional regulator YiaG
MSGHSCNEAISYDKKYIITSNMSITGQQIRVARAALSWSVQDLSDATGVGTATIVRYEMSEGAVPKSRKNNLGIIRTSLEAAGIVFIGTPEDGPGIRMYTGGTGIAADGHLPRK